VSPSAAPSPRSDCFTVELPLFSGPFRLLATLILEQKVDICEVPIARVTDSFRARGVTLINKSTLEETTWFLAACAALLELKVGRLLPRPVIEREEELLGGASPDLVYARSVELAAFRRMAQSLAERIAAASLLVPRMAAPPPELAHLYPDFMQRVTPATLHQAARGILAQPDVVDLSHVTPILISLSDGLSAVEARLAATPRTVFRDILSDCSERIEVVVRFLALLELHREGKVQLEQSEMFGDIAVEWQGTASPPEISEAGRGDA